MNGKLLTKNKKAFALSAGSEQQQAQLLISGKNEIAELIIALAKISEIPIQENQKLADLIEKDQSDVNQSTNSYGMKNLSNEAISVLAEVLAALHEADQRI